MSLPQDAFDTACQAIIGSQFAQPSFKSVVQPNPELMRRLVNLQKSACLIAKTSPELFELPEIVRAFEQNSVHLMVRCLTEGTISTMSSGAQRHAAIVRRFEEFLEANPNTPFYLTEICAAVGAAERTIRALRGSSWYGADPLPRLAENASRPPSVVAGRSFDSDGDRNRYRPRLLGVGTIRSCLSRIIQRAAIGHITATAGMAG